MCTAVTFKSGDFYFGRTLDNDFSYGEEIAFTPRNFPLPFRNGRVIKRHYAIIGTAHTENGLPLYYDAVNEKGLCAAGLNFVGNAVYNGVAEGADNIAHFEIILWLLSQCDSVDCARKLLKKMNITNEAFSQELPPAQLHWVLADERQCLVIEAVKDGLKIHENPYGVLANNPPFEMQAFNLSNYMGLSAKPPVNSFAAGLNFQPHSKGMGALGLPGDLSSPSRFVRAAFTKNNSVCGNSEEERVGQFFHILSSVWQTRGCCAVGESGYEITVYASCCNASKGVYYYTTYGNRQITAVDMRREDADGEEVVFYPFITEQNIKRQN